MKSIKRLGLVALAALMTMFLVGVSSAMAESTALCLEDSGKCQKGFPASQLIAHVHETTLGGRQARLLSSLVEVKCDVLFLGDVTSENSSGNPLEILGHFTYPMTGCQTTSGTLCEIIETSKHTVIKIVKLGHELADVTYEYEVNFHCGALINCIYNGTGLKGHGLGPLLASEENGEIRIEEQVANKTGGAFCPKTAKLDLLTTPLSATYFVEGSVAESTALCPEDPGTGEHDVCPEGYPESQLITHVHEATLEGNPMKLLFSPFNIQCDVLFLGDVTSENSLGAPLVSLGNLTYTNCETSLEAKCEFNEISKHTILKVLKLGHELASVEGSGEVNVRCGNFINCTYNGIGLMGHALGPLLSSQANGETLIAEQTVNNVGGSICPKSWKLDMFLTPLIPTYITP